MVTFSQHLVVRLSVLTKLVLPCLKQIVGFNLGLKCECILYARASLNPQILRSLIVGFYVCSRRSCFHISSLWLKIRSGECLVLSALCTGSAFSQTCLKCHSGSCNDLHPTTLFFLGCVYQESFKICVRSFIYINFFLSFFLSPQN